MTTERTQHCECGSELYHVKFELSEDGDAWVECADCGRRTSTVGDVRGGNRQADD